MVNSQTPTQTAGWKLFNYYWPCRVPYVHTLDPIETALRGIPTSGRSDIDEAALKEMVRMSLPVVRDEEKCPELVSIVELFEQGVDIEFLDGATPAKIYDHIREHLQDQAELFNNSLFFLGSVIEADESKKRLVDDLLLLEKFANAIHPMVERFRPQVKTAPSTFIQTLEYWRLGKTKLFGEPEAPTFSKDAPNPFTSALTQQTVKRLRPWSD